MLGREGAQTGWAMGVYMGKPLNFQPLSSTSWDGACDWTGWGKKGEGTFLRILRLGPVLNIGGANQCHHPLRRLIGTPQFHPRKPPALPQEMDSKAAIKGLLSLGGRWQGSVVGLLLLASAPLLLPLAEQEVGSGTRLTGSPKTGGESERQWRMVIRYYKQGKTALV